MIPLIILVEHIFQNNCYSKNLQQLLLTIKQILFINIIDDKIIKYKANTCTKLYKAMGGALFSEYFIPIIL